MEQTLPELEQTFLSMMNMLEEEKRGKKRHTVRLDTVIGLAESKRLERAKNTNILTLEEGVGETKNIVRYEFEAESKEKSEAKSHIGYIELMKESGNVHSAYCSCSDMQSRLLYYNEKNHKIASYKKGDEIGSMNEYFDPHSQDKPDETNPNDDKGIFCKHLLKVASQISNKELI